MKKYRKIIIALGLVIGLVFLGKFTMSRSGWFGREIVSYVNAPLGTVFSSAGQWLGDKFHFLMSIGKLKQENQDLFEENLRLRSNLARLEETAKENEALRKELSLAPRDKYNLKPALVIGRESGNYSEIIYLNKGSRDGLQNGQAVLVGEGVLVGRIIEVEPRTSKVRLIIDKDSRLNAKIIESDGKGIVEGRFGTSLIMTMIPQTVEVKKGDTVVTSKLSGYFRDGLLIGYVQDVSITNDKLFQEASLVSPVNFDKLYLVWVLQ